MKQQSFLSYLVNCHDLWDQADNQVLRGGHAGECLGRISSLVKPLAKPFPLFFAEFFIDLDHANGPITLHSSIDGAVRYVRAGLQKLRQRDTVK